MPMDEQTKTGDDWNKARGITRGVLTKLQKKQDAIEDEALDDIIRSFIHQLAQRKAKNSTDAQPAGYQRTNNADDRDSLMSNTSTEMSLSQVHSRRGHQARQLLETMHSELSSMLSDPEASAGMIGAVRRLPFVLPPFASAGSRGIRSTRNETTNAINDDNDEDDVGDSATDDDGSQVSSLPTSQLDTENHGLLPDADTKAHDVIADATTADDDKERNPLTMYRVKDVKTTPIDAQQQKRATARVLFLSDLEFLIKHSEKDTLAVITLHNCLAKACAYEVRTNNPDSYVVQPNIGLAKSGETVEIRVWLRKGYDVKVLDSIMVTTRPVHAYYMDPTQIRWLWRTAKTNSLLQYVLHCRGVVPSLVKEAIKLSDEHLVQLKLEMNGEHTKYFAPCTRRPAMLFMLVQGAVALLVATHYGVGLHRRESHEWAELFGISILQHVFLFEVLKVLALAACAASLRKDWLVFT